MADPKKPKNFKIGAVSFDEDSLPDIKAAGRKGFIKAHGKDDKTGNPGIPDPGSVYDEIAKLPEFKAAAKLEPKEADVADDESETGKTAPDAEGKK